MGTPQYAILFLIDATAKPLWEDDAHCIDVIRLLAALRQKQYTVIIGVTKMLKSRENILRDIAHGSSTGSTTSDRVGQDARSCYEVYVARYLEKVCKTIHAAALKTDLCFPQDSPEPIPEPFPTVNKMIFDVPSWTSVLDHKTWQGRKGTLELPNLRYFSSQLKRVLAAVTVRSKADDAPPLPL